MSASRRSRSRHFKRVLANLLVVLLGVVALLLLAGLFLPRRHRVDRTLETTASPAGVFARMSSAAEWSKWAAWPVEEIDSGGGGGGAPTGEGARVRLTRVDTNQVVDHVVLVHEGGMDVTWNGSLRIEPRADGAHLVWTLEGDLGRSPWARYQGFGMRRRMGDEVVGSLAKLKQAAEAGEGPRVSPAVNPPAGGAR